MGYSINTKNHILYVRFQGVIDTLDVIQLTKDPIFLENMRTLHRVIYDYCAVEEADISFDEAKNIGFLGALEANFTEHVHAIFVLKDHHGQRRVQAYKEALSATSWKIDICPSCEEAEATLAAVKVGSLTTGQY